MEITAGIAKGQLMTLTLLVLFILMLSILIAYVTMSASYGSIAQNVALSQAGSGYGSLLAPGLEALIRASASQAIQTLAVYEASPDLRNGNFITNASASLASLITTGTLSGATAGTPAGNFVANSMQDLTLASYNAMLMNSINASYSVISINQSGLMITQGSPYSLSISLVDNVAINASGSLYDYHIPINVSIPLNGTPDLYDAQRGSLRYLDIKRQGVPSPIGSRAEYANAVGFAYGTFVVIPGSDPTCTGTGNYLQYVPPALATAPLNKSVILVVPGDANSLDSAGCSNNYAGLVTNTFPSGGAIPGGIPWLVYPSTFSLSPFQTGGMGLLYGPLAEMLNISGVQAQAANGDFFASGYAPSYQSRASGSLATPSPYGLFTLQGLNYQAGSFNGQNSLITGPALQAKQSVSLWLKTADASQQVFLDGGTCGTGGAYQLALTQAGGVGGSPAINTPGLYFSIGSSNVYIPNYDLANNGWHNIVASWDGGNTVYLGIDGNLPEGYVWNGISWGSLSSQPFALPSVPAPANNAILIGGGRCQLWNTGSAFFNGMISDVQLYSSGLEANQLLSEYLGGVQGLPTATQTVIAWWPLNGNSNDYSGGDNTATAGNVVYALLQNYSRSSIFNAAVNGTDSAAVPGILSCSNSSQCSDADLPHLYLGTAYMRNGGPVLLPYFNGETAYEETGATPNTVQYKLTSGSVFEWVNTTSNNAIFTAMQNQSSLVYLEVGASTDGGNNNQLVVYLESSSGYSVMPWNSLVVINDNAWRQIGVTWNGLAATMYINGNAVASNDFTGAVNLEGNLIDFGALPPFTPNADYEMAGSLADVQIYNQSLSGNQVYALYKEGLLGMPLPGANVVGWWPMLGNGNDYSGLGVDATASQYLFYRYLNSSVQLPGMQTIKTASTAGQTFGFG